MTTVYDVPPGELVKATSADLKDNVKLNRPEWSYFVKTGPNRERAPENEDWWYTRAAAILRKIYMEGPVGVQKLRVIYGGSKNRGRKPEKFKRSGGKVIRSILQEFDKIEYTKSLGKQGRRITDKGKSYLDRIASSIAVKKEQSS